MKKGTAAGLTIISVVSLCILINQALFELELNKLQNFCDNLKTGLSLSQVEARVQEWASLRLSSPRLVDDDVKYVNVFLEGQTPNGWVCDLAFRRDVLFERVFGSDHGARKSFLKRQ